MKAVGIICEYDPFHKGHAYLLSRARELGETVVCVMSGHATQRGRLAMADKYTRAEMALVSGADLVLELPFPHSAAGAEYFAAAGVGVLAGVGATDLCFGSELGDVEVLSRAASLATTLAPDDGKGSRGTAKGYFEALNDAYEKQYGRPVPLGSNDILGVAYLKARLLGEYDITPHAVVREGDGFRATAPSHAEYASATALRACLAAGDNETVRRYIPTAAMEVLTEAMARGEAPADMTRLSSAVLSFFRLTPPESLGHIAELGNGLEHRLCRAAREASELSELLTLAATKKYTHARIARAMLFAMTGVTREDMEAPVAYTTVLAANAQGRRFLGELRRREGALPAITRPADGASLGPRQYALGAALDALFTQTTPKASPGGTYLRRGPRIREEENPQ